MSRLFSAGALALLATSYLIASAQELQQRAASADPVITPAPGKTPNSNVLYQELRSLKLSGESSAVNNLVLKRDVATFTFKSGSIFWTSAVNGKVTGAVFVGDGTLDVDPVLAIEKRSMTLLTKGGPLHEEFNSLVLRFTDATHEEVTKSAGTSQGSAQGEGEYDGVRNALKDGLQFGYNLDGRILQDVMSTQPGGLFYAFVKGKRFDGKELLAIDPYGDPNLRPEEVVFTTYSDSRSGAWVSEHFKDEYKTGKATGTQQT